MIQKTIEALRLKNKYKGEAYLLFITLLWSGTFVIIKEALADSSPVVFLSLRFSLAAIILLPFALKYFKPLGIKEIKAGIFLGFLMFLAFAAQTAGLKYTTATKSAFITGSLVVIIPFLQFLIEKKMPSAGTSIGTVLVFSGILFLSGQSDSFTNTIANLGGDFNIGDVLTLICALIYALHIVMLDVVSRKINFRALVFLQVATVALCGWVAAIIFDFSGIEKILIEPGFPLIWGVVYTAVFATVITTTIQTRYQKTVTPAKAGIIYSFEPIFATLLAFFLLNEKITIFGIAGCLLIFIGLLLSELYDTFIKTKL